MKRFWMKVRQPSALPSPSRCNVLSAFLLSLSLPFFCGGMKSPNTVATVAQIEFTFLLVFTINLPSHAVQNVVANSKVESVNKALDNASCMFQAGVAAKVELIATGELVGSDSQVRSLINLIIRFQLFLFTNSWTTDHPPQPPGQPTLPCHPLLPALGGCALSAPPGFFEGSYVCAVCSSLG